MALPKQIRNQIKQNEEITTALLNEKEDTRKEAENAAQAEIDSLLAEVESPAQQGKPKAEVTELHPAKEEGGDLQSTAEKVERTDWKQKYSVLKGKYDAEVPRLSADLRDANRRIEGLENKLAELASNKEPSKAEPTRSDFTPEEIADYGEDLLDVIGRKARQIVEAEYHPQIVSLQSTVASLKSQLGETGQRVGKFEQNEVFAQLDRHVENWRKINTDPEFHEWLDKVDPFSGESRKTLLLRAFDRKNAHQVEAFFKGFIQENAAVSPNSTGQSPSGQGGTQKRSTLNLNDYVAPGQPKGGAGTAGAPKDKRMWTSAEVGKFYSDIQKGRYKNRPEDRHRIEADIVAATREGRITS